MLVIDSIRLRDDLLVKALGLPRLVSTDEQNPYSPGIEGEKMRIVCVTRNSFMLECREPSTESTNGLPADGPSSCKASTEATTLLLGVGQRLPPTVELVGLPAPQLIRLI